jgi:molybdenum cofactor biosynthesis protein B
MQIPDQYLSMDPTHHQDIPVSAGIITVSSSRSSKEDKSGAIIHDLLIAASIPVSFTLVVPDSIEQIRSALIQALETSNCVILTGGTGITSDDCTIEAVAPLLEKTLDGFGELFRAKSLAEVGTRIILSRAVAGIIGKKVVFCIPGSPNAATLATKEIIIPEVKHILTHASR